MSRPLSDFPSKGIRLALRTKATLDVPLGVSLANMRDMPLDAAVRVAILRFCFATTVAADGFLLVDWTVVVNTIDARVALVLLNPLLTPITAFPALPRVSLRVRLATAMDLSLLLSDALADSAFPELDL